MSLRPLLESSFVGREKEIGALEAQLAEALAGHGRLVTISGEAGVGKTRAAEELLARSGLPSGRLLWGRCPEQPGAPAYWPWTQALRGYVEQADRAAVLAEMGSGARTITRVLPALREHLVALEPGPIVESEESHFQFFDAMVGFLRRSTERAALVIVLDDLHWADPASIQLLAFLTHELRRLRLLVVGTYRTDEVEERAAVLDGLRRASERVRLRGLDRADVGRLAQGVTGVAAASGLVADLHRLTEGNPFFIGEFLRVLETEGALESDDLDSVAIRLPAELSGTIHRRLGHLDADERQLLEMAAVVGREFDVALLQMACDLTPDQVLERLATPMEAKLVDECPGELARFRFGHTLIRQALYDAIPPTRRVHLHRRIGEALEAMTKDNLDPPWGQLAYHFLNAAPLGEATRALDHFERAGHQASASFAHSQALEHFERALQVDALLPSDDRRHLRIQLAVGFAARRTGDISKAQAAFAQASRSATALGDFTALARAALGYTQSRDPMGVLDPMEAQLLSAALEGIGPADSRLRVNLLLALSRPFLAERDTTRRLALADEALAAARRLGDPATLAIALASKNYILFGTTDLDERLGIATEAVRLAEGARHLEHEFLPRIFLIHDLLESCDIPAAKREVEILARNADQTRLPFQRWAVAMLRAGITISSGEVEEGARLAAQALELRRDARDPIVLMLHCAQLFRARRELGPIGDSLERSIERFADDLHLYAWRCVLAAVQADEGRTDAARSLLEQIGAKGFDDFPRDALFLPALALLSEVVHFLDDRRRADEIYPLLAPYADRNVVTTWWSPSYAGSVARYLGLLAVTARRPEAAAAHFEQALTANARMGIRSQLAHTKCDYARLLFSRNGADGRERAQTLLAEARETAERLGLIRLRERIARLKPPPLASGGLEPKRKAILRREGHEWTIGLEPRTSRLKGGRGFAYLATLVREPGREFHVLDLAASRGSVTDEGGAADLGDAGDLLDVEARAAYRRRLADLDDELEEARRFNDPGRISRAEQEREFLSAELTRAVGLGGRSRRAGAASERARVNVTRIIGRAIERIAAVDPALGQHLAAAVRRGSFCCYEPDARLALQWDT